MHIPQNRILHTSDLYFVQASLHTFFVVLHTISVVYTYRFAYDKRLLRPLLTPGSYSIDPVIVCSIRY